MSNQLAETPKLPSVEARAARLQARTLRAQLVTPKCAAIRRASATYPVGRCVNAWVVVERAIPPFAPRLHPEVLLIHQQSSTAGLRLG